MSFQGTSGTYKFRFLIRKQQNGIINAVINQREPLGRKLLTTLTPIKAADRRFNRLRFLLAYAGESYESLLSWRHSGDADYRQGCLLYINCIERTNRAVRVVGLMARKWCRAPGGTHWTPRHHLDAVCCCGSSILSIWWAHFEVDFLRRNEMIRFQRCQSWYESVAWLSVNGDSLGSDWPN